MPVIREPLKDKAQTVDRIFYLARKYAGDLDESYLQRGENKISLSDLSLGDFFNFVKSIPYKRDIEPVEIVARPSIIIKRALLGEGKDCKKAAILMGAYFTRKKIPWRLATVSTRSDCSIHHVFPQAKIFLSGSYINADATYNTMKIGQAKKCTAAEYYE